MMVLEKCNVCDVTLYMLSVHKINKFLYQYKENFVPLSKQKPDQRSWIKRMMGGPTRYITVFALPVLARLIFIDLLHSRVQDSALSL